MSVLPEIPEELRDQLAFRAKRELRKRIRGVRSAMPPSAIEERSTALCERVLAMPEWARAQTVALFSSMPDEVQCRALIERARSEGKRAALPVVVPVADEVPGLVFRAPWDGGIERPLVTSAYGIDEPSEDAPAVPYESIDLVIVPALAIDERGHRIGYGKGYYDRTLPRCTRAARVVVGFDFQLIAEVPTRAGDVASEWIVTDKRVLRASP